VKTSQEINQNQLGVFVETSTPRRYSASDRSSHQRLNWWQRIYQFFVGGNELNVWQTIDRTGQSVWHAYDPLTGASTVCRSESEMVDWIETCYYNSRPNTQSNPLASHHLERDQRMML
jgi:hypothetical protein